MIVLTLVITTGVIVQVDSQLFNASTVPGVTEGSGENPLVSAVNGSEVNITCEVFRISDGVQRQTVWTLIRNGTEDVVFLFLNGLGQEFFENFAVVEPERARLTILDFNNSFDNTQLGCGSGGEIASRFELRIIRLPVLIKSNSVQTVAEMMAFSLNMEEMSGFPILPDHYQWQFNGLQILDNSMTPNVSEYPFINFTMVERSHSGNYSLIVSNEAGFVTGYFILDVQYKPEGVAQPSPQYFLAGENASVLSFKNITGNPVPPTSDWSIDGDMISGGADRYIIDGVLGQLTIISVTINDTNNYTNSLTNSIGTVNYTVEVIIFEPASMPRDLTILGIGSEFVNLSWINPLSQGTPTFSEFEIFETSFSITVHAENTSDHNFRNKLAVTSLKPNTMYNIMVRALTVTDVFGTLFSESSENLIFNTTLGSPRLSIVSLDNSNGSLTVSWTVLSNGGIELSSIMVECSSSSGDDPSILVDCSKTTHCSGQGEASVGPVIAGSNYTCSVSASNSLRTTEIQTNYIIAMTGTPSSPVIISISGGPGMAVITVEIEHYGVLFANDFEFIVTVFNYSDIADSIAVRTFVVETLTDEEVTLVIQDLPQGIFLFTVESRNSFGSDALSQPDASQLLSRCSSQLVSITEPATINTTTETGSTTEAGCSVFQTGLFGGLIAVIIIQFLVILIVSLLFFMYYWKQHTQHKCGKGDEDRRTDEAYELVEKHRSSIPIQENSAYGQLKLGASAAASGDNKNSTSDDSQDTSRIYMYGELHSR